MLSPLIIFKNLHTDMPNIKFKLLIFIKKITKSYWIELKLHDQNDFTFESLRLQRSTTKYLIKAETIFLKNKLGVS